jgi:hypothetical protein
VLQDSLQKATLCSKMPHPPMGDTIKKALFSRQKNFFPNGTVIALYTSIENETFWRIENE